MPAPQESVVCCHYLSDGRLQQYVLSLPLATVGTLRQVSRYPANVARGQFLIDRELDQVVCFPAVHLQCIRRIT
jgi:hypothetical protein